MGYYLAMGHCWSCGLPFTFNPERVPSVVVGGERQPVCLACVQRANPLREQNGLPPIVPHPSAYEPQSDDDP